LEALFSSRVRVRLLTILLLNPDSEFHARALTRMVGAHYNAIWKELRNLERAGLLLGESSPAVKSYRLNPDYPILPELRAIILKTAGVGDTVRQALAQFHDVQAAFIYSSFASGDTDRASDIDLMVIGSVDLTRLAPAVSKLEEQSGRAVNYIAYSTAEWRDKLKNRDPFVTNVLAARKIMFIGCEDALRSAPSSKTHQTLQGTSRRGQAAIESRRARPRHRRAKPA
jgi:predicted nucleotidyltransferase